LKLSKKGFNFKLSTTVSRTYFLKIKTLFDMAKGSNIITHGLSGNLGKVTFVRSKRYGEHIRSQRGTFKPALLNDTMKESSQRMASANVPAKAIFDAVRLHHKDGELWNKLVVIFRKQLKAGVPFHINDLKGLECHETCTLDRLTPCAGHKIQIAQKEDNLCIGLVLGEHPSWSHLQWKHDFQYRLSMIIVYPNLEDGSFIEETAYGPVTAFTAPVEPLSFEVPIPVFADK
jgi:hypothetical protein